MSEDTENEPGSPASSEASRHQAEGAEAEAERESPEREPPASEADVESESPEEAPASAREGTHSTATEGAPAEGRAPREASTRRAPKEETGTTSGSAPSTTDARSASEEEPFKPETPIFGGIVPIDKERWAAWTGGKPLRDWSGLEKPVPDGIGPAQYRSLSPGSQAKSRAARIEALENKFTRDASLQTFQIKVKKHLVTHGMDTIAYIKSPADPTELVSIIEHHALFELEEGVKLANDIKANHYDSYCHINDEDAKAFLLKSVDSDLETQLIEDSDDNDSFVAMWLHLMHIIHSVSIDRFDKIKDRMKARKVSDYAGENIESIASDYLKDYRELHGGSAYDNNLTMFAQQNHGSRRK